MTPVRLLLNSSFSGANAFLAIAEAQGLFKEAQLDLQLTPGHGAYTAAARLIEEGFDAAYGDLNALIEIAATNAARELPVAVFAVHQHAPSTVTVARAGPIRCPADLAGCRVLGHGSDVATRTFAAYAQAAGLARDAVTVLESGASMATLLQDMLAGKAEGVVGKAEGVFGYVTTHTAVLSGLGIAAADTVRFLPFRDVCPALYGSVLMVAPRFMHDHPAAVARLVAATRAGIVAAQSAPELAIDAVLARNPAAQRSIEEARWQGTLLDDMGCRPDAQAVSGDVDDVRLTASIKCLSSALGWARSPAVGEIFTRRFLP